MHASATITIQGIDAFTTAKEFSDIFENFIVPFQTSWRLDLAQIDFKQKHGRFPNLDECESLRKKLPQPHKPPFERPVKHLPVWKYMHAKNVSVDKAVEALEAVNEEGRSIDCRNARRGVKKLDQLMKPVDSYGQAPDSV